MSGAEQDKAEAEAEGAAGRRAALAGRKERREQRAGTAAAAAGQEGRAVPPELSQHPCSGGRQRAATR